jgi:hypothetical protein
MLLSMPELKKEGINYLDFLTRGRIFDHLEVFRKKTSISMTAIPTSSLQRWVLRHYDLLSRLNLDQFHTIFATRLVKETSPAA